ncbi:MAG: hypothetical protein H8D23_04810 [Candidatus Brocadiales bacterium]|nr:hypothetical protein [Candidatus Brocadiales bacterium]
MGYKDYDSVDGVLTMSSREDFQSAIQRITSDSDYYDIVAARQKTDMSRWGKLDGKSGERMLSLFDGILAEKINAN